LPGFTAQGWFGFFGPAGLPAPITAKLNEVAVAMLREPALLDRFEKLGIQADPSTPVQFARYLQEQDRLWAGATKGLNLQLD
jgi:tripartite-type tricarboxylate transporter receptor subunit TctC